MPDASSTILALESSCDETAAAVVRGGRSVLSSFVASQNDLHEEYAGVVPEIASRAHVERVLPVVRHALEDAGVGLGMLDAIAVGNRPGLIGSLLIGVSAAKALAWSLGKPLIGVDHVHAHLYAGVLRESDAATQRRSDEGADATALPAFPALGLVVSGGHTSIYLLRSWTDLTRLGGTIDDALGEAYDKAATILGLPYPGGPNLDRLAATAGANDRAFDLPISRLAPDSLDFSFSGLKTSLLYQVRGVPGQGRDAPGGPRPQRDIREVAPDEIANLAASFQRAASRAVILKLERALARVPSLAGSPARVLLVGGGVSANSRLRAELQALAASQRLPLFLPPMRYCVDNAAMVGGLAFELWKAGRTSGLDLPAVPTVAC